MNGARERARAHTGVRERCDEKRRDAQGHGGGTHKLIIARGPLKARLPSKRVSGVFPKKSADDCFSKSPSSLTAQPVMTVPHGCSPAVPSSSSV